MKASELKQGETYGTVWGEDKVYIGSKVVDVFNPMTDEREGSETRYMFKNDDGTVQEMDGASVERFVSSGTVEISTKRLNQIMNGVVERDGKIDEALRKVNKLTAAIEDMKLDCDAEVYDTLLAIADILGR